MVGFVGSPIRTARGVISSLSLSSLWRVVRRPEDRPRGPGWCANRSSETELQYVAMSCISFPRVALLCWQAKTATTFQQCPQRCGETWRQPGASAASGLGQSKLTYCSNTVYIIRFIDSYRLFIDCLYTVCARCFCFQRFTLSWLWLFYAVHLVSRTQRESPLLTGCRQLVCVGFRPVFPSSSVVLRVQSSPNELIPWPSGL